MRIVILVDRVKAYGAERVALTIASGLSNSMSVTVVSFGRDAPAEVTDQPFEYRKIKYRGTSNVVRGLWAASELRRFILRENVDVIMALMPGANMLAALSALGTRTQVVVTEHNMPSVSSGVPSGLSEILFKRVKQGLYKTASMRIAVSQSVRADLSRYLNLQSTSIECIYNPIDYDSIERLAGQIPPVIANEKIKRLLIVGRLKTAKGHRYAIAALEHLPRDFHLYIVGDGELEHSLRGYAVQLSVANRVHFEGFQDNPYMWMRWADVLLVPSLYEGFGLVVAEAAAIGLPAVVSDAPALPEIARMTGALVVPTQDTRALAKACEEACDVKRQPKLIPDFTIDRVIENYVLAVKSLSTNSYLGVPRV